MKKIEDFGIHLFNLTDAEFIKIMEKFGNLPDDWDSYGPDDNFLYMEHLTLKQYKEVKKWLEDTFGC